MSKFLAIDMPDAMDEKSTQRILILLSPETEIFLSKSLIFFFITIQLGI